MPLVYNKSCQKWTIYVNFVHVYNNIIDEMADAGIAEELGEPVLMQWPNLCLYLDEVGGNVLMKGDGHVRGELYLTEKGIVLRKKFQPKKISPS